MSDTEPIWLAASTASSTSSPRKVTPRYGRVERPQTVITEDVPWMLWAPEAVSLVAGHEWAGVRVVWLTTWGAYRNNR